MRSLTRVDGKYRIYLRELEASCQEGLHFHMQSAFLTANTLATVHREPVYVTEDMGEGQVKRLYVIPPGGGMPELMEEAKAPDLTRPPVRGLDLDDA
jgi:hypothetical protein